MRPSNWWQNYHFWVNDYLKQICTVNIMQWLVKELWLNYWIVFQFKQKSSSVSFCTSHLGALSKLFSVAHSSFSSSPLWALCLHSLFKSPSAASNQSVCLSSRFWPSFISPFNLNSASSSCIHHDPLRGWSHLQPLIYNYLTPSLLPCLEPRPHTSKHRELKWDANTSLPPALFLWEWNSLLYREYSENT